MARPRKQTVDYFPHDTDACGKKTLTILQSKFGNDGYAFWFKLLELLGKTPGHYFCYGNPAEWEFLLAKTGVNSEVGKDIINTLAILGAIDQELFEVKCLWSANFIDNIADAYNRREDSLPERPSFLLHKEDNNGVSVDNNEVSDSKSAHTKLKETKLYKNKRKAGEFWLRVLEELRLQVSKPNYTTWLSKTKGLGYEDGIFYVEVPSVFAAEYLDKNQRSLVEKSLINVMSKKTIAEFCVKASDVARGKEYD